MDRKIYLGDNQFSYRLLRNQK